MRSGWGKRAESQNPGNIEANLILISPYTLSSSLIARPYFYFDWNSKQRSDVILYVIYFRNIFLVFVLRIQADLILLHFAFFYCTDVFLYKLKARLSAKRLWLIYWDTCFTAVVWNRICTISEVCLYTEGRKRAKNREANKDATAVI